MNGAYLHLIANHLPVLGVLFGLAIGLYGLIRKEEPILRVALGMFVLIAVVAFAANWSGEKAEDVLEEAVPTVSHDAIHAHEDVAEKAAMSAYLLGLLALATLGLSWGKPLRKPFVLATLAGSLIVSGLMTYTSKLGGEIRHTEAMALPSDSPTNARSVEDEGSRVDRDDDD